MSVASLKTAVICENPLRDSDRVASRPGAPASAVSIGKVICFSISVGDSAGAVVLICTCLLVISGTASIGSPVSAKPPSTTTVALIATTTQRRAMERPMIRSIIAVLRVALFQLRLQREGIDDGDGFPGGKAADDF